MIDLAPGLTVHNAHVVQKMELAWGRSNDRFVRSSDFDHHPANVCKPQEAAVSSLAVYRARLEAT